MSIAIDKTEYRLLLDIVEMADMILTGHAVADEVEKQRKPYLDLIQKIYSHAKEYGYENLIEYDEEFKKYMPTREYEDTTATEDIIDDYDDQTFWLKLKSRLVQREYQRALAAGTIKKPDTMEDYFKLIIPLEEKFEEEFEAYGLEHVEISGKRGFTVKEK